VWDSILIRASPEDADSDEWMHMTPEEFDNYLNAKIKELQPNYESKSEDGSNGAGQWATTADDSDVVKSVDMLGTDFSSLDKIVNGMDQFMSDEIPLGDDVDNDIDMDDDNDDFGDSDDCSEGSDGDDELKYIPDKKIDSPHNVKEKTQDSISPSDLDLLNQDLEIDMDSVLDILGNCSVGESKQSHAIDIPQPSATESIATNDIKVSVQKESDSYTDTISEVKEFFVSNWGNNSKLDLEQNGLLATQTFFDSKMIDSDDEVDGSDGDSESDDIDSDDDLSALEDANRDNGVIGSEYENWLSQNMDLDDAAFMREYMVSM
jgi:hypothetical protein